MNPILSLFGFFQLMGRKENKWDRIRIGFSIGRPVGDTYSVRGRRNCFGDATPLLRGWSNNVPGGFPLATSTVLCTLSIFESNKHHNMMQMLLIESHDLNCRE